jgi:23S rRNA (cytidine1920-2'-O)/16S rRNA (cytidine1409-2'-O)-methyltransferase
MAKQRLDQVVSGLYSHYSRAQIQSWIMQGKVLVNGTVITKSGAPVAPDAEIIVTVEEPKYVSRAGFKLEKALDFFGIDPTGLIVLDAGLSTGGFSDCLLQRGAARIYGVDVGYGQAHEKIRADTRVVVMERTNLRHLASLPELVDLVTLDLSFISVLKVLDAILPLMKPAAQLIILIKPQFEAEREDVGRGGIIKDPAVHQMTIDRVVAGVVAHGFTHIGTIESPILGATGNKEFLAYFKRKF